MSASPVRIIRVLNNNAVLTDEGVTQMVLLGRGIGFGRRDGDLIDEGSIQHRYIKVDPKRAEFLNWSNKLGEEMLADIGRAVEIAVDALGHLHPAIYTLLFDHIAFAVQRVGEGEQIVNELAPQIRTMFAAEYDAARLALHYLNSRLAFSLPEDEAGFIALHLNAAREGATVKMPLRKANELAELVNVVSGWLGSHEPRMREHITRSLVETQDRVSKRELRRNDAAHSIRRDLASEYEIAAAIITTIISGHALPKEAEGEAAFLAVQIHGWRQDRGVAAGESTPKGIE